MVKVRIIVLGVHSKVLQERLLRAPTLSLDKTVEHCKLVETAKYQQEVLHKSGEMNVYMTNTKSKQSRSSSEWQDRPKFSKNGSGPVDAEYND